MKILKRKIHKQTATIITELLYLDCGKTIAINSNYNDGVTHSTVYHVTGFDEVGDFLYNTDGVSIGKKESKNIKKGYFELLEKFFFKMQDENKYKWFIDLLTDNYYDYTENDFNAC